MNSNAKVLGTFIIAFAVAVAGCLGGSAPIAVVLSLTGTQNVVAGQVLNITAMVSHDSKNAGVTWSISPSSGAGTLSGQTTTSVTYTAPSPVPANATATITATSITNTAKSVSLTINLQAVSIALTPSAGQTDEQGQTTNVTAAISNDPMTKGVTWGLNAGAKGTLGGATTTSVTYHAPANVAAASTDTITATSVFDNTKTATLTINLVPPPSVTTTSLPSGTVGTAYTTTNLAATGGVTPYTWSWTAQAGSSLPPGLNLSNAGAISGTPAAFGTFNVTVQVKDANNLTATANLSIKINPAPVTITTTSLPNGVVSTPYSATLQASGGAPPITWSWAAQSGSTLPPGLVLNPATGAISGTPTVTGTFNVTVTATDSSTPALTASKNLSLTVGQSPAITSANSTTFTVGMAGTFSVTTTGFPAPSLAETGALPTGVTFKDNGNGSGALSGTPAAGTGKTYSITFTASNGVGSNATQNFTLTVDEAPAITSANTTTFSVSAAGSFTVTTTGFPAPSLTEAGALPSGVTFVDNGNGTGKLSGTPASGTSGSYPIMLTASNGIGSNATQNFTLTVNTAPVITSANSTTFTVGAAGSFTVTTTGTPTPSVTEAGALPSGVTFTANANGTGTLSGTPAAGTGKTYSITFTASNGVGSNATQNFTLTVDEAPSITSPNTTTFTAGASSSFTVMTKGFPAPAVTETGALPSGVNFVDNGNGTGTLSGTPASGSLGTYNITFTAANGVGAPANQAFTLTVNTAPVITSASSTTFTVGTPSTFTVTTTGTPTPTLSETGALPSGVTFTANANGTATLAGTPAAGSGGTYPITIKASSTSGNTTQAFTLTVKQAPAITSANSTTFTVGTAGSFTVTTTGFPTPALTETGALPSGVTFTDNGNGTGKLSGTPAAGTAGTYPITITASNGVLPNATQAFTLTVSSASACGSGSESLLSGGYALLLKGFDSSGNPALVGGVLTFNGSGSVTAGTLDMNLNSGVQTGINVSSGTFSVGSDHRGCMSLTTSSATNPTQTYRFSLGSISGGVASTGHMINFDSGGPFTTGILRKQSGGPFSNASVNGSFAFGGSSIQNTAQGGGKFGFAGVITFNGSGGITGGSEDINQNGILDGNPANTPWPASAINFMSAGSSYSIAANGRGTLTIQITASVISHDFLYGVSSTEALFMNSDSQTTTLIGAGQALKQSGGPFSGSSVSGPYVGYVSGLGSTAGTSAVEFFVANISNPNISATDALSDGGTFSSTAFAVTYTVTSAGRMVTVGGNHPPLLYVVNSNQAFFLGSHTAVESGFVQTQTGSPFSAASFNGAFAFGDIDPQTSTSYDVGAVTSNGVSMITGMSDNNGSGSQSANQTFSQSYSVDSATGLVHLPSGCTPGTNCQAVAVIISPTKFAFFELQHNGGMTQTNPKITIGDQ